MIIPRKPLLGVKRADSGGQQCLSEVFAERLDDRCARWLDVANERCDLARCERNCRCEPSICSGRKRGNRCVVDHNRTEKIRSRWRRKRSRNLGCRGAPTVDVPRRTNRFHTIWIVAPGAVVQFVCVVELHGHLVDQPTILRDKLAAYGMTEYELRSGGCQRQTCRSRGGFR